jgi:trans-aconitate methyltransferase
LVRHFLRRWIKPGDHLRIADLATGSGDIPRVVVDYARSIGAAITVHAVDQQSSTLEIARRLSADYPEISFVESNILEWQPPQPCDIVLCSLALHHFSEEDAIRLLRRARQLSRKYVLVSDLRRGYLAKIGVYLLTALIFREPMTRYDAKVSAERAFSFREMRDLAGQADWTDFGHGKFAFGRQAVWLERPD